MKKKRRTTPAGKFESPPPVMRECGHEDPYERPTRWVVDGEARVALVCHVCAERSAEEQAIPCIGCGGFDPRPGHPGMFNSPTGYYGGGHVFVEGWKQSHWFPWCEKCLEPVAVICSSCMVAEGRDKGHVCGRPLRLASNAGEMLWHRLHDHVLPYQGSGIEFRHLLGDRDWPAWGDDEESLRYASLPPARSMWASRDAAEEAIRPFVEAWAATLRSQHVVARAEAIAEVRKPIQLGFALDFKKVRGQNVRNLVIDLLAVDPQQPSGHLTCVYCGITMFGTVDELRAMEHKPRCAWLRAQKYLAETSGV